MSILDGSSLKSLLNLTGEQVCADLLGDFLYFSLDFIQYVETHLKWHVYRRAEDKENIPVERRPLLGTEF